VKRRYQGRPRGAWRDSTLDPARAPASAREPPGTIRPVRIPARPTRDWAVAVFVVWRDRVMLHRHPKLGLWLPCGGHVEEGELPDAAAVREVEEESGVRVRLLGRPAVEAPGPRQLTPPRGIQLETIADGHEHIDLVYLGAPHLPYDGRLAGDPTLGWFDAAGLALLPLTPEIVAWTELARAEVGAAT
jgi:8-oxo-dGTP pyrophosphatase MutT (NUDIX family)